MEWQSLTAIRSLLAGPRGTEVIESLVAQAAERLRPGGHLLLEISPTIHDAVRTLEPRLWASFPLSAAGVVGGTLTVVDRVPRNVDERWTQLGASFAAIIATFMERADAEEGIPVVAPVVIRFGKPAHAGLRLIDQR